MQRQRTLLLAALAAAAPAAGQTVSLAFLATDTVDVTATDGVFGLTKHSLPTGTDLARGVRVLAQAGPAFSRLDTGVVWSSRHGGGGWIDLTGLGGNPVGWVGTHLPFEFLLTAPTPVRVVLTIDYQATVLGPGSIVLAGLVHRSSFFMSPHGNVRRSFPLTLGPTPAGVSALAFAGLTVSTRPTGFLASLRFELAPDTRCTTTSYGSTCPGSPSLEVLPAFGDHLDWAVRGAPAVTTGVLALGTRSVSILLPMSSCLLLAEPLLALPFLTDARGEAALTFPAPIGTFAVFGQALLPGPPWRATPGVRVTCP